MSDEFHGIPSAIYQRLLTLKPTLERNGVLEERLETNRHWGYRLRFRVLDPEKGYLRRRSITIHDPKVAVAVRRLLADWQFAIRQQHSSERQARRDQERLQREARRNRLAYRKSWQAIAGGGRMRRRQAGRLFDQAEKGGMLELWRFGQCWPPPDLSGKPGRPYVRALLPIPSPGQEEDDAPKKYPFVEIDWTTMPRRL